MMYGGCNEYMISETARIYSKSIGVNVEIRDFAIIYDGVSIGEESKIGEHSVIGRSATPTSVVKKDYSGSNVTIIEKNVSICANVIIYSDVSIGENSLIGDNSSIMHRVTIGNNVLISRGVNINTDVKIGSFTRIMDNTHITGRVNIGNNVFISAGVTMANDSNFGKYGYDNNVYGAIIDDYVSIGVGATILPGVRIGRGSIIAAGSVIKKDVPDNVIVSGNPARIVSKVPQSLSRLPKD